MNYDRRTAKIAMYHRRVANGDLGVPISLQVALTDACFNRCPMCSHPQRKPMHELALEDWISWLAHFKSKGVETICYSGGDPLAYHYINRVMDWHNSCWGIPFGMTIAGHVPAHIDLALLATARWVRVSLDAVTPSVYEQCRGGTPVSKVLDGIKRMKAAGVNVCLGITTHSGNINDLPNVLAFAADNGITDIDMRPVYPDSLPEAAQPRDIKPFNHCSVVFYQLYISANGDVHPCCITAGDTRCCPMTRQLGNLYRDTWHHIWANAIKFSHLQLPALPEVCRTCCVQRLSEINHVCDIISQFNNKNFF